MRSRVAALFLIGLTTLACTPVPARQPAPAFAGPSSGPAATHVPTIQAPTFTPSPSPLPIIVGGAQTASATTRTPTPTSAGLPTTAPPLPGMSTPGPLPGPSATPLRTPTGG